MDYLKLELEQINKISINDTNYTSINEFNDYINSLINTNILAQINSISINDTNYTSINEFNDYINSLIELYNNPSYNFKFKNNNLKINIFNLDILIADFNQILELESSIADFKKLQDYKNKRLTILNNKSIKLTNIILTKKTLRRDKSNLKKSTNILVQKIITNFNKRYIINLLKSDKNLSSLYRYCRINNILPIKHLSDLIKNYSKIGYNKNISVPITNIYSNEYSGYSTNKVKCINKLPRDKSNLTIKKINELNGTIVTFDESSNNFINTSVLRYSTHKTIGNYNRLPCAVITMPNLTREELLAKQAKRIISGYKLDYSIISKFSIIELDNAVNNLSSEINLINDFTHALTSEVKIDCNSILNNLLAGIA